VLTLNNRASTGRRIAQRTGRLVDHIDHINHTVLVQLVRCLFSGGLSWHGGETLSRWDARRRLMICASAQGEVGEKVKIYKWKIDGLDGPDANKVFRGTWSPAVGFR
jgi:hypothetical protein